MTGAIGTGGVRKVDAEEARPAPAHRRRYLCLAGGVALNAARGGCCERALRTYDSTAAAIAGGALGVAQRILTGQNSRAGQACGRDERFVPRS